MRAPRSANTSTASLHLAHVFSRPLQRATPRLTSPPFLEVREGVRQVGRCTGGGGGGHRVVRPPTAQHAIDVAAWQRAWVQHSVELQRCCDRLVHKVGTVADSMGSTVAADKARVVRPRTAQHAIDVAAGQESMSATQY